MPSSAPSSFEGEVGYVRFTAEAQMERPWKFNHVTRSAFTVISLVDLNMEPPEFKVRPPIYVIVVIAMMMMMMKITYIDY